MTTAESTPQYLYFFITNCEVGEGGQVMYDLELDTVQTYFFDPSIKFADCLIERAHLNRFEKVDDTTVKFVTDPASKIYNAEDALNFPKRLTKRTRIGLQSTGNAEVDNWLNTYVDYWVYVFLSSGRYDYGRVGEAQNTVFPQIRINKNKLNDTKVGDDGLLTLPAACYCYPVFKKLTEPNNVGIIRLKNTTTTTQYIDINELLKTHREHGKIVIRDKEFNKTTTNKIKR